MTGIDPKLPSHQMPHRAAPQGGGAQLPTGRDLFGIHWAKTTPIKAELDAQTASEALRQGDFISGEEGLEAALVLEEGSAHLSSPDEPDEGQVLGQSGLYPTVLTQTGDDRHRAPEWFIGQAEVLKTPEEKNILAAVGALPHVANMQVDALVSSRNAPAQTMELASSENGDSPARIIAGPEFARQLLASPFRFVVQARPGDPWLTQKGSEQNLLHVHLGSTEGAAFRERENILRSNLVEPFFPKVDDYTYMGKTIVERQMLSEFKFTQSKMLVGMHKTENYTVLPNDAFFESTKTNPFMVAVNDFESVLTDMQVGMRSSNGLNFTQSVLHSLYQGFLTYGELRGQQDGNISSLKFSLQHKDLGNISFVFRSNDGAISVYLGADRPETLDLLRRNVAFLNTALKENGFENISFSFGDGGAGSDSYRGKAQFLAFDDAQDVSKEVEINDVARHPQISDGTAIDCRF